MSKRYEIKAFLSNDFRGLMDSAETNDYEEMKEIVWDFIQEYYVEITDWKTGKVVRYVEPEDIYYDGEIDIDLDSFAESYRKFSGRKRNLRENENNKIYQYEIPFGIDFHFYDRRKWDDEITDIDDVREMYDQFTDTLGYNTLYEIINEKVENIVNKNKELQKINLKLDEDNVGIWDAWFLFTTTPYNLNNAIELIRKNIVGLQGEIWDFEYEYYGEEIFHGSYWEPPEYASCSMNVDVEYELTDMNREPEIISWG